MKEEVIEKLLALNRAFYEGQAASFAESRAQPQPGFSRLLAYLPQPCKSLLDVGCGQGRFGRFIQSHHPLNQYVGIDFSAGLLAIAQSQVNQVRSADFSRPVRSADFSRPPATAGTSQLNFLQRDMTQPGFLADLGHFDAVVCLAALHHIPGRENRVRLVREMAGHLGANGRLILSTWQFLDSQRQQRKIRDWSEVGLSAAAVEANDYLLTWQRGGFSYRYACMIDAAETAELARAAHLDIIHQFRSDGQEGDLSLYTVLAMRSDIRA